MKNKSDHVEDPVCGMRVLKADLALEYQQMHFAFCSQQCRERFQANPHLYIGYPGEKAPKQEDREEIRRRRISLDNPLPEAEACRVREALGVMMGVRDVLVHGHTVEIEYDLLQVTQQQLEEALAEAGMRLGGDWRERLRRAFVDESEEWQIDCMEVKPPHNPIARRKR